LETDRAVVSLGLIARNNWNMERKIDLCKLGSWEERYMKIEKAAQAGTVESNDIMISVSPAEPGSGCNVTIVSPVLKQYGRQIKAAIEAGVKENGIEDIIIHANDKGALDCTIKARLNVAILRAVSEEEVMTR